MRTFLVAAILTLAGPADAQEDKKAEAQKAIAAAKIESCAKLKAYFEKQEKACPEQAAQAKAVECKTAADGDKLIALNSACAKLLGAGKTPPSVGPNADRCQALAEGDGALLAEATDADASKCREAIKAQLLAKQCEGSKGKLFKYQYRRGERKPAPAVVFCPKK